MNETGSNGYISAEAVPPASRSTGDVVEQVTLAVLQEARENGADSACDYGDAKQIAIAAIAAMPGEPVAWQWRCCIAGQWGAWLGLEQPVERFKTGTWAFNLANGTAELRPLYAAPVLPAPSVISNLICKEFEACGCEGDEHGADTSKAKCFKTAEAIIAHAAAPVLPATDAMREALEHVTELLVDTWNDAMEGDCEMNIAVIDARAALSQPTPSGWQPIETAPKDGHIIGWWSGYKRPCVMWWNVVDQAFESWADRHENPSHWQSLPAPPEVKP